MTYDVYIWSGSEVFVLIICGSIPPFKILYDRHFAKTMKSTQSSSSYMRSDYTSDSFPLKSFPADKNEFRGSITTANLEMVVLED